MTSTNPFEIERRARVLRMLAEVAASYAETDIAKLKAEVERLRIEAKDIDTLRDHVKDLDADNDRLREMNKELQEAYTRLRDAYNDLDRTNQSLSQTLSNAETSRQFDGVNDPPDDGGALEVGDNP